MRLFRKQKFLMYLLCLLLISAGVVSQEQRIVPEREPVRDVHITVDEAVNYAVEHSYSIRKAAVDLST